MPRRIRAPRLPGVVVKPLIAFQMLLALVLVASCDSKPRASHNEELVRWRAREVLAELLEHQVSAHSTGLSIDPSAVEVDEVEAGIVPDLRYYFAVYRTTEVIPHPHYYAVAGTRAEVVKPIRGASDWAELTAGWSPTDGWDALIGCKELLLVTRARSPDDLVFIASALDTIPMFFPSEVLRVRAKVQAPEVTPVGHGKWQVDLWVIQPREPRGAVRYRCVLPLQPATATSPVVLDSVALPEVIIE